MDRLDHRTPWGHAKAHRSPRELKCLTEGMIPMWTARASEEARIKFTCGEWQHYPGSSHMEQARQQMKDLLKPWGMDQWRCIEKFNSDEQFRHIPLWTGGKCWNDFHGDARPDMPPTNGRMVMECDIYLPDYDPSFWSSQNGMGVDTGHGST